MPHYPRPVVREPVAYAQGLSLKAIGVILKNMIYELPPDRFCKSGLFCFLLNAFTLFNFYGRIR